MEKNNDDLIYELSSYKTKNIGQNTNIWNKAIDQCIETIKNRNNIYCIWKDKYNFVTGCGYDISDDYFNMFYNVSKALYCPFCSRKIKFFSELEESHE